MGSGAGLGDWSEADVTAQMQLLWWLVWAGLGQGRWAMRDNDSLHSSGQVCFHSLSVFVFQAARATAVPPWL